MDRPSTPAPRFAWSQQDLRTIHRRQAFSHLTDQIALITHQMDDLLDDADHRQASLLSQAQRRLMRDRNTVNGQRLVDKAAAIVDGLTQDLSERQRELKWWGSDQTLSQCARFPHDDRTAAAATDRLCQFRDQFAPCLDVWMATPDGTPIAGWLRHVDWRTPNQNTLILAEPIMDGETMLGQLLLALDFADLSTTLFAKARLGPAETSKTKILILNQNHRVVAAQGLENWHDSHFPLDMREGDFGHYVDIFGHVIGYARAKPPAPWTAVLVQSP